MTCDLSLPTPATPRGFSQLAGRRLEVLSWGLGDAGVEEFLSACGGCRKPVGPRTTVGGERSFPASRRAAPSNRAVGAGAAMSGQGRPFLCWACSGGTSRQAADRHVLASGPTKEARPSPGPWDPCPSRITDRSGAVWDGSFQTICTSPLGVSPPALQRQGSEGLSSGPFITVTTKADLETEGGRNRLRPLGPPPRHCFSFLM